MNISEAQEQRRKAQKEAQRVIELIERIEAQMAKASVLSAEWDELNEKRKRLTVKARQKENPVSLQKTAVGTTHLAYYRLTRDEAVREKTCQCRARKSAGRERTIHAAARRCAFWKLGAQARRDSLPLTNRLVGEGAKRRDA